MHSMKRLSDNSQNSKYKKRRISSAPKHDLTYYFEDGNIILRVETILFKVHRVVLSKDGSAFNDMFSLPTGVHGAEGGSDRNPAVLSGDTPVAFRNLLWALYALPTDVRAEIESSTEFIRMMDVASLANKYGFTSHESWAVDALDAYSVYNPVSAVKSRSTESLITIAMRCSMTRVLKNLLLGLEWRVTTLSWRRSSRVLDVLLMANRLGLLKLEGHCYYTIMLLGPDYWQQENGLTEQHKARLLKGLDAITRVSESLSHQIAALGASCCQTCRPRCTAVCTSILASDRFSGKAMTNVLGRMKVARHVLHSKIPNPWNCCRCSTSESDSESGSDSDIDAGSDTGGDGDADQDSGEDEDVDSKVDGEPHADGVVDSDGDDQSDLDLNSDSNTDSDADSDWGYSSNWDSDSEDVDNNDLAIHHAFSHGCFHCGSQATYQLSKKISKFKRDLITFFVDP